MPKPICPQCGYDTQVWETNGVYACHRVGCSLMPIERKTTHTQLMQMYQSAEQENMNDIADPLSVQIGGMHYKDMVIQPMEYSMKNRLDPCQHTIIKYVSRFRAKGGIQDLEKAKHCIDLLIAFERGVEDHG